MEPTEIPDVRQMDRGVLQTLIEPIVANYTSLSPATAAALENFIPGKSSSLISGRSIVQFSFCSFLTFHFLFGKHVHFAVPQIVSSKINLATLFM